MLVDVLRAHGVQLLEAIGDIDVLVPLLAGRAAAISASDAIGAAVPSLLCDLATSESPLMREALLWDTPIRRMVQRREGRVFVFEPRARALIADCELGVELLLSSGAKVTPREVSAAGAEGAACLHPFHAIASRGPSPHLAGIDTNPLALIEAHPEKSGNELSWGQRPIVTWIESLTGALELIRLALPHWHAELATSLQRIIPVGYEPERHLSASYREAPGLIYLTLHPDPITLAEALIHETQHGKLNALSWIDPILVNGYDVWTTSPVRPDLRPLMGVLLAVHAFVPVAALHASLAELAHPLAASAGFVDRRAAVLASNAKGLAIIERLAEPTAVGKRLIEDLRVLHQHLERLAAGNIGAPTSDRANADLIG